MKNLLIGGIIVALAIAGYFIGTGGISGGSANPGTEEVGNAQVDSERTSSSDSSRTAQRPDADLIIGGRVMSVSDTEIIIGTYEQANRGGNTGRAQQGELSEQEREAFRAQRQAERENAGEPEITGEKVITLNADTQFLRGAGQGGSRPPRGTEDEEGLGEQESIDSTDIVEGATVRVLLKEGTQEALSVSLQEQR